jgi:hypothetical protein
MVRLDRETLNGIEVAVALLGAALLLAEWLLHRRGRPQRLARLRDGLLAAAALVAALCWWSWPLTQPDRDLRALGWVHFTDSFHYYMGPKYFRELGYTHLYECAALAEQKLGGGPAVSQRVFRDLASNELIGGRRLLAEARACRARFTPERWQLFVSDVAWFQRWNPYWESTLQDWGYNATPAWNALGMLLAGNQPVSERSLAWLTLLDVPVLLGMWALVAWAFGWRTLCVALIFWGTWPPSGYNWTGGSILRHEWLLASVAGICLLRKQKWLGAGALIAYATSLSIFPGFLAAGIGAGAVARWVAQRRFVIEREQRQLLLGAGLALALVLAAAALAGGGPAAWLGFVENSRVDSQPSPNNMGLPTLLSYERETSLRMIHLGDAARPALVWAQARAETLARRAPLWAALGAGYLVLWVGAVRRQPEWVAAILGLGVVVLAFQLSCYYYAFMLSFGLLWPRHRSVGLASCGLTLAAHWIGGRFPDEEEQYAYLSLLAVLLVVWATAVARLRGAGGPEPRAPRAAA